MPTSGAPELGFTKLRGTGSGSVEVHLDALSGTSYRRMLDSASDFSPGDAVNGAFGLFGSAGTTPELGFVKTFPPAPPVPPPPVKQPPIQQLVQTQTLPAPPAAPAHNHHRRHARGRIRARFVIGWTCNHRDTRLHSVLVTGVPRDGRLAIRCQGRGCPEAGVAARYRGIAGLLRSLEGRVFRAGNVVTITVSAPKRRSERISLRVRDGHEPVARLV